MKTFSIILLFLFALANVFGNTRLGFPKIVNYTKDDYKAATMNWAMVKDQKGKMYFANNYGLIAYDGVNWDLILEPANQTNVTALGINQKDCIYLGADSEFGYVITNELGQVNYKSLLELLPEEERNLGPIWQIIPHAKTTYFFTRRKILIYQNGHIESLKMDAEILFAQKLNSTIYLQLKNKPLVTVKGTEIKELTGASKTASVAIKSLFSVPGKLICATAENGFFELDENGFRVWTSQANQLLEGRKINTGLQLVNGKLAIGTVKDGLFIFKENGSIDVKISKEIGLQNNTIQAIYQDDAENVWIALGNGISYVELGSEFYYMDANSGLDGSVYSTAFFNDSLFLATNQGLYVYDHSLPDPNYQFIANSDAHSWNLTVIDENLMLSNHNGAYIVERGGLTPINTEGTGAWQFVKHPHNPNYLFQGSYEGIFVHKKTDGIWRLSHKIEGFDDTAREIVFDADGKLWLGHGYHGIYCIELNDDFSSIEKLTLYNTERGLPDNYWNNLNVINGELLIGTKNGVYEYNRQTDQMIPNDHFQQLLGGGLIRKLVELPSKDVFFIKGLDNQDVVGIVNRNSPYAIQTVPFQKLKGELIPAFEAVVHYNDQLLIGSKDGLIIYKHNTRRPQANFSTAISRVFLTNANDSIVYGHPEEFDPKEYPKGLIQEFRYKQNALKMNYAATYFEGSGNLQYRTFLVGFDNDWTGWTHSTTREYTNLKEGSYTFRVESRNIYGAIGTEDTFEFKILPPWYRTLYMYFVYLALATSAVLLLLRFRKSQIAKLENKREQQLKQQKEEHQRKNLENEQKLTILQMEKLRSEVEYKSKELASSAVHLAQQNDTLLRVIEKIEGINTIKDRAAIKQLKNVVDSLKDMIQSENNWDHFELHFNEIHNDFIKRLKIEYPSLTARDIRLCAYLRMNLSSKEIAPLLGISYRGVESLRYRIRKKISLNVNDNLTEYILDF